MAPLNSDVTINLLSFPLLNPLQANVGYYESSATLWDFQERILHSRLVSSFLGLGVPT